MTNLYSILKRRNITLPTKGHLAKAMVFPIVMYGCKCWTIKKAERRRIDAFELCCWRRLLRIPWIAKRSNQSILKEISSEYLLEGHAAAETPLLWPPDAKNHSFEKTLMLGKIEGRRRKGWQRMRWLDGIINTRDLSLSKLPELVIDREDWHAAVHRFAKSTLDWVTELNWTNIYHNFFIHSSVNGKLGCFQVLATVNSAAVSNGIHGSFLILLSSGYMPRSRIAGSYGGFIPNFF